MFNRSTFFAALFVLLGFTFRFSSATPPACVLACVNEQEEVYNYEDVCKTNVADVAACLKKVCDSAMYDDAITSYKASCKEANYNVVIPTAIPSSTSAAKTTGSSSTRTGSSTPTYTSTSTSTTSNSTATGKANNENSASTVYYNSILALIVVFATAAAL
ncbi:hypothetical protein L211DRAFT_833530 [Terfezia boudieri ATCC MYA-4762]|uniref:Extracellular membrane protein CFEM domain-containing protein n=1 Tax=Terfezia boudieri ATCC MYA-4762 TaxID=1051890 RepID=A0A3N4M0G9_9PEZI|nr:hypothetical protein L211DRAFT_833530 [Terfezia boudieri ATCC MYA-4762]